MAAKYRKIDPRIWADEKFQQMPPHHKLLALYVLTAQANRIGIFRFSLGLAAEDIGWVSDTHRDTHAYTHTHTHPDTHPSTLPSQTDTHTSTPENIRDTLFSVCDTLGWQYDSTARVMYLPNWWKYNACGSDKTMKGLLEDLHDVPKTPLIAAFLGQKQWLTEEEARVLDTHAHTLGIPIGIPIPIPMPMGTPKGPPIPGAGTGAGTRTRNINTGSGKTEPGNGKRKTPIHPGYTSEFELFWKAYPRRNGRQSGEKSEAFAAWLKLTDDERTQAMTALPNYVADIGDGFPKDACRFLAKGIYIDHLEPDAERPLTPDEEQAELSRQFEDLFEAEHGYRRETQE